MSMGETELWNSIRAIEGRLNKIDQDLATMKNDRIHMDRRFDQVEKQISSLADTIGKVGWFLGGLVATAIIGGFMSWVLTGGLAYAIQ